MPKVFTSASQRTGEIGEYVAVQYLERDGYTILERNYTKKWGEIDIVAKKGRRVHFVEVKSKSVISFEYASIDRYRAEDGMHPWKLKRLRRTIQTYLLERRVQGDWQFDLATVYLNEKTRTAKVQILPDIVI